MPPSANYKKALLFCAFALAMIGLFAFVMAWRHDKLTQNMTGMDKVLDQWEKTAKGSRSGSRDMGIRNGKRKEYERSAQWFSETADLKAPDSCLVLALFHFLGVGVLQDDSKGMEYLHQAVELGNDAAREQFAPDNRGRCPKPGRLARRLSQPVPGRPTRPQRAEARPDSRLGDIQPGYDLDHSCG